MRHQQNGEDAFLNTADPVMQERSREYSGQESPSQSETTFRDVLYYERERGWDGTGQDRTSQTSG